MALSGMTDQLGRVLSDRYRLTAPIGTGSSAQVFLADDVTLRRRVAVKVLHPALAADEAFLRRFRAEARAAAALSHPNLMAVYDWGEDDGPYLVLEFLGGGSLRGMLDTGTRLSTSQAVVVGLDAARALDAAHRRDVVHRDIKPANLLFGDDGRLRIADFGLARALSEAAWTEPGDGLVGTARYAAPEQSSGPRIDGKADVYALGLVLIEAVTGQVPLTADTALGTLVGRVDVPVPVSADLGPLRSILERAGQPDPADRPTANELAKGLLAAARTLDRPGPLPLAGAVVADAPHADPTLLPGPGPGRPSTGAGAVDPADQGGADDANALVTESSGPRTVLFDELATAPGAPVVDTAPGLDTTGAHTAGLDTTGAPTPGLDLLGGGTDGLDATGGHTPGLDLLGGGTDGLHATGAHTAGLDTTGAPTPGLDLVGGGTDGLDATGAPTAGLDTTGAPTPGLEPLGGGSGGFGTFVGDVVAVDDTADDAGRRRRWPWLVLLLALGVLVAAGWFGYRAYLDAQPTTAAVPSLETLERGVAEAELVGVERSVEDGLDWQVEVEEEHNEVVLAGFVVDQEPQPGTVLEDGETVRLVVSLGPPPRAVPELFNRTEDEARVDLTAAELALGSTEELNVEDVEAGRIISWSVAGEDRPAEAPKGSEVDLIVSAGPAVRTVPELVGAALGAARADLGALGLVVRVVERFSTSVDRGVVISSSPGAGATLARGSQVELVVSKGRDLVVVPEVAGLSIDDAIAALRSAGLTEGDVSGPAGGAVNATDPEAGATVDRTTVVDLFLRR